MVGLGHRRLAVVTYELTHDPVGGLATPDRQAGTAFRSTRLRLAGYRDAAESVGVSWDDVPVYECPENVPEEGEKAARFLLEGPAPPTAILTTSDQLAFGVIEAARKLGLSVPKDVSVAGYDDVPEAARSNPPLTSVHQDHVQKGILAGRLLVDRLEGGERGSPKLLPTRLVVRESAAPPRRG